MTSSRLLWYPEPEIGYPEPESTCERAELVLRHLRRRHAQARERHAEQAAGEAMGRLTRAFVLLCLLRIVIAQQQRRRWMIEQRAALAWDRQTAPGPANNV